ncbi:MAG TPA: exodeoxyribonuclease III [Alphaproteobacteria bacterium]|nr:exodeoxyribonuclease III [Paracoccaceae bacterium]RCL79191.1 MAG: exodeoxyribonuclease III [SAR116 cluster bacterium]HBQ22991.1 exodeoxyribonuclease III [Alphaproteobacteria bacterium]HCJ62249.1 exodeoxyribonuclease III [Alphaproteobacteria bacterium]HCY48025.1 exodeoxyribonuclease III [Alphaproteobacteria bacterium]|tara:strand:+ start:521 stop:1300 length:780 start_codon:yes stop_codon:yes gene_type:complete
MHLVTWNINSIRARLGQLGQWLDHNRPDILCLQELKCQAEQFPHELFEDANYNIILKGQKSYNGVAIASRFPMDLIDDQLAGDDEDEQARFLDVVVAAPKPFRLVNIYAPNGNPAPGDKFAYKLAWNKRLHAITREILSEEGDAIITGDFNIIPDDHDVHNPEHWVEDALFRPESRAFYHSMVADGWTDCLAMSRPEPGAYTFWDYQAGAFPKNHGIRIDHIMASPSMADRLLKADVDKDARGMEKPSDHAPVSAWFKS